MLREKRETMTTKKAVAGNSRAFPIGWTVEKPAKKRAVTKVVRKKVTRRQKARMLAEHEARSMAVLECGDGREHCLHGRGRVYRHSAEASGPDIRNQTRKELM
jgi:hypothetical protein